MTDATLIALLTPELGLRERAVYAYLVGLADERRIADPTVEDMQRDLGIKSRHGICGATGQLSDLGLIEVRRRRMGSNVYRILDPGQRLYGSHTRQVEEALS
jgi:hypothetical protein